MTPLQQFRFALKQGWLLTRTEVIKMPQVIIRNPKTEAEYGIDSADFRHKKSWWDGKKGEFVSYADAGFRIVSLADGQPYTGPLNDPPAERKAEG